MGSLQKNSKPTFFLFFDFLAKSTVRNSLREKMKKILFVCVENPGRSQMAEAFANHYGEGKIGALSAGIKPAEKISLAVVVAMKEKGIDISANKTKLLTTQIVQ